MPEIMEAEPRDARFAHRRIERPQQIARIPWVACPVEKDRLRAAGPHRGARLQDFHRRVIHRQRVPGAKCDQFFTISTATTLLPGQDKSPPSGPMSGASWFVVSCEDRLSEVGLSEIRKPQVSCPQNM
jgi:hypothetical protein